MRIYDTQRVIAQIEASKNTNQLVPVHDLRGSHLRNIETLNDKGERVIKADPASFTHHILIDNYSIRQAQNAVKPYERVVFTTGGVVRDGKQVSEGFHRVLFLNETARGIELCCADEWVS